MSEIIYVLGLHLSTHPNIYKIGSTRYLKNRMMTYKTSCEEFSDVDKILYTYTFSGLSCYDVDKIINKSSTLYNIPFTKYDKSGGNEFYIIDDLEKLDVFLCSLDINFVKKKEKINELTQEDDIFIETKTYNTKIIDDLVEKIKLREWQNIMVETFINFISSSEKSGIFIAPTGCGKSFMMMYMAIMYTLNYKQDVVIMTKRKEIFSDFKTQIINMARKLKANIDVFDIIKDTYDKEIFNNISLKNRMILINSDKFIQSTQFKEYQNFKYGKIKLFIQDECHWSGGEKLSNFLEFIKTKVDKIIGFSATPSRLNKDKKDRTYKIFGNGVDINVLFQRDYITAIDEKDIVPIEWNFFNVNLSEEVKEYENKEGKIFYILNKDGFIKLQKLICDEVKKSVHGKGIVWFRNIKNLNDFYDYVNKDDIKYYYSHSKISSGEEIDEFKKQDKNTVLLVVYRATEGFDDPKVDFGIRAYFSKKNNILLEIQRIGRIMRICKDKIKGKYITMEIVNSEFIEHITKALASWIRYIKEFNRGKDSKKKNKLTVPEIIDRFFNFNGLEIKSVEEIKQKIMDYVLINKSKMKQELKRYVNKLNLTKIVCTTREELQVIIKKKNFGDIEISGNIVKFCLGDMFEEFSDNYYDFDEFKEKCKKIKCIEDYEKEEDEKIPKLKVLDSGFYYESDDNFSILKYIRNKSDY